MAATKKGDFLEIEFVGRNLSNDEIFDTNIPEEAKKINPKTEPKPLAICVGQGMVVRGLDEALEGKETGKKYTVRIASDKGFGKRQSNLVRLIPLKVFAAQKVYPQPGMTFALDNTLVKIVSVSGGRVMADFNHPLAGKDIEYEFTINKILEDVKEKVNALQNFLFGQIFEYDLDEKNKKIIFKDLKLAPILNAFKDKFKEMLDYGVEIIEKKKEDKKEDKVDRVEEKK